LAAQRLDQDHSYDPRPAVRVGIGAGFATCLVYASLVAVDLPDAPAVVLAAAMGPLLGAASWGLREFLSLHRRQLASDLAAASNAIAGAVVTAMFLVQIAIKNAVGDNPGEDLKAVYFGLDVAWDVYIGLGTVLFAMSAATHPRLGRAFALTGALIGVVLLALNLATFPTPPADDGLVDVGPLVGLWYLAVVIAMWRSLDWARERARAVRQPLNDLTAEGGA
jgi:hypothetical protein